MTVYVVMEPPSQDRRERVEGAVFIRDGFSFLAFLLPVIWLLARRLWLEALAALVLIVGAGIAAGWAGLGQAAPLLSLLVSLYFGLESNGLRIAALRRRGWSEWGPVEARDREEAELRYAAALAGEGAEEHPPSATPAPAAARPPSIRPSGGPALGLFSYPGSR
ncbi:MAG: DUF2628 domain-containing protein [Rhizobiaceae bacterium]|nr:DUF2628 domain-containing protein [Rhizobiaceae bacterium]MCV0404682.1 DUF2628 domain-containing protein [Rhizobiaceae bacterium]